MLEAHIGTSHSPAVSHLLSDTRHYVPAAGDSLGSPLYVPVLAVPPSPARSRARAVGRAQNTAAIADHALRLICTRTPHTPLALVRISEADVEGSAARPAASSALRVVRAAIECARGLDYSQPQLLRKARPSSKCSSAIMWPSPLMICTPSVDERMNR